MPESNALDAIGLSPKIQKDPPIPSPSSGSGSETPTCDEISDSSPSRTITGTKWILVCLAVFSANVLYGLDTTIAADIQGAVSESFENVTQLGWLGVGFNLGSTAAILPLGKAYALFDTKWIFIGCLAMFAAASALCGASPNMNAMIVGRIWAGCGGSGMYLGTLNLISETTTPTERAFYNGLMGFIYGGGCILGPIVGGSLADNATWRWAFYLNLIIFGIMSPIHFFILPSLPHLTSRSLLQKLREFDWLGIVLIASLYSCFAVAFAYGGSIWAWSDGRFLALVILSGALAVMFAVAQYFVIFTTTANRLFPCDLLGSFQFILLYVAMSCGGAALFVSIYYIPLFFLFVYGDSGTEAAIRLLPFIFCYIAAILACGYLLPRLGYHFLWYLVSALILTAGGSAMYVLKDDSPISQISGASVLLGFGLTVGQAGYDVACRVAVAVGKGDRIPEVLQFMNIAQGQSQLLGLIIASSIFQSVAFDGMKNLLHGFSNSQIQSALAGAKSEVFDSITGELRVKALGIIVHAIHLEWLLVVVAGAVQAICSLFMSKTRFP